MTRVLGHLRLAAVHLAAALLQHGCLEAAPSLPGAAGSATPVERGELLLSCLMALGEAPAAARCTDGIAFRFDDQAAETVSMTIFRGELESSHAAACGEPPPGGLLDHVRSQVPAT